MVEHGRAVVAWLLAMTCSVCFIMQDTWHWDSGTQIASAEQRFHPGHNLCTLSAPKEHCFMISTCRTCQTGIINSWFLYVFLIFLGPHLKKKRLTFWVMAASAILRSPWLPLWMAGWWILWDQPKWPSSQAWNGCASHGLLVPPFFLF